MTSNTYRFTSEDIPSAETLLKIKSDFIVPSDHKGTSEDEYLARLWIETPAEQRLIEVPMEGFLTPEKDFKAMIHRFSLPDSDIFWSFGNLGVFDNRARRYYLAYLVFHYGEKLSNLSSSIIVINQKASKIFGQEMISPETLDKYFEMNTDLKKEGIVLKTDDLILAAAYWTTDDVIELLLNKVDLIKVKRLASMGVISPKDIIEHQGALPESWLDDFFGDLSDEDDDKEN